MCWVLNKLFPSTWYGLHLHQVWRTTGSSVSSSHRGLSDSITLRDCCVSLSLHRRADPCPVSDSGSDLRHVIKLAICRTLCPSASLFGRQMGLLAPANKSRSITTYWQRSAPFDSWCDLTAWFTYYTSGFSTVLMCGRSEIDPCRRIMRNLLKFSSLLQLVWSNSPYYTSGFSAVLMCGRSEIDPCCRIMRNLLKFSSLRQSAWSNGLVHVLHQRF